MKRAIPVTAVLCILIGSMSNKGYAQFYTPPYYHGQTRYIQSLYFELFGNGIFYSLNYDVLTSRHLGTRLGAFFDPGALLEDPDQVRHDEAPTTNVALILMENYFLGTGRTRIELGAGGVLGQFDSNARRQGVVPPAITFTAGIRILPTPKNHVTFKFAYTPFISHGHFFSRFGLSVGFGLFPFHSH